MVISGTCLHPRPRGGQWLLRGGCLTTAWQRGQAGALLLAETLRVTGLGAGLPAQLARWRAPRAVHDPGKILTDLAVTLALGGDCLADAALLRAQPQLAGPVASDPVISRLVSALAADAPQALRAIRRARAAGRERAWALAGDRAPGADGSPVVVDIDATIVTAHSEKQQAAPTWKKTFGFHPLAAFADHGTGAGGEALAILLRAGNAGSSTAAEHIEVTKLALAQLPRKLRRRVLIRTDSGGGTHEFLSWLASPGRRLHYSIGMTITDDMQDAILALPDRIWEPAYDASGQVRPGAWVAELTGLADLAGWPEGMRVIVRKERPHPGAQLRFTDIDGHRFTAFATDARRGQLADLELRHRRRARCEDRILLQGMNRVCRASAGFWLVSKPTGRLCCVTGVVHAGRRGHCGRAVVLSWAMSSRLAARAAVRSSSRCSSWSRRSMACCSRRAIFWARASMSAGVPSPDSRQACSPRSSDRRCSSCRTRAVSRMARSWAASRSACMEARVTTGPAPSPGAGGVASSAWILLSRSRCR